MNNTPDLRTRWTAIANKHLAGRTITHAFYMNEEDTKAMDWYNSGLVMVLDNGVQLMIQQDDEGNGPGAVACTTETACVILPTL